MKIPIQTTTTTKKKNERLKSLYCSKKLTLTKKKMPEELVHGLFKKADTIDPYRYQHINDWTHRFGTHKGKLMKDIPTDDLLYLYIKGLYSDDKFKYNASFRRYIYYRYREDRIADKTYFCVLF